MATYDGSINFDTQVNTDGINEGVQDAGKQVEESTRKMDESLKKMAKTVGAVFAVDKVKSFAAAALETTASLQALDAQFDQIFQGEENQAALDAINQKSEELGIHADRLTSSFSQFGAQVKGAGMQADQALNATTTATQLAADAAAFYDTSLENATASISSFMKGNFEAGDAIGVFTNASQMNIASQEKLGKKWEELTEAERQWLLLDTISKTYEQNGASGQAAREMDSWANATGNLHAAWDRFIATLSEPFLETTVSVVQGLTDALRWLIDVISANPAAVEMFFNVLMGLLAGIATYYTAKNIVGMINGISGAFKMFGEVLQTPAGRISILISVIVILVQMLDNLGKVWDNMSGVEKVTAALGGIIAVAFAAALAVGAFQSALTMGIAAAAIVAGITAMAVAIKSAESQANAAGSGIKLGQGMSYFNPSAPRAKAMAVPALATGAVIPPNNQFLAVLGDQRSGRNLEAPESLIRQIVREESGGGNAPTVNIQFTGSLAQLARVLNPVITVEDRRRGTNLVKGGGR